MLLHSSLTLCSSPARCFASIAGLPVLRDHHRGQQREDHWLRVAVSQHDHWQRARSDHLNGECGVVGSSALLITSMSLVQMNTDTDYAGWLHVSSI
jgi:hypothetical protein